jgi:hypothetical protein
MELENDSNGNGQMPSDQLWTMYFDMEKYHCMGILEMDTSFINAISRGEAKVDFDNRRPLAYISFEKVPQEQEEKLNFMIDWAIASIAPNLYLLMEALHEDKSEEVVNYHLAVYNRIHNFISTELGSDTRKLKSQYPSLDRVNKPFQWKYTKSGWLVNQHDQKIIKFDDPELAKWVSIAGSQFSHLFHLEFQRTLNMAGFGGPMISIGSGGQMNMSFMGDKATTETEEPYQMLKEMLPNLKWSLQDNLKNMKIFLE